MKYVGCRLKIVLLVLLAAILAACAATPPAQRSFPIAMVAADISIAEESIVSYHHCFYAFSATGGSSAPFEESACIRTRDQLIIAKKDESTNKYVVRAAIPLSGVKSVRLHKYLLARQVQVLAPDGVHALTLLLDEGLRVHIAANEAEYEAIAARGIPHDQDASYVSNSNRVLYIPVPIIKK